MPEGENNDYDIELDEKTKEIVKDVEDWSKLESYSDEEREKRAFIQQEYGELAITALLDIVEKGGVRPFYVANLVSGIEPTKKVYDLLVSLARMSVTYLDSDHSAINDTLELMLESSRFGEFLNDVESLKLLYDRDIGTPRDLQRLEDHITRITHKFKTGDFGSRFDRDRKESKEIYSMGIEEYNRLCRIEAEKSMENADLFYDVYDGSIDWEDGQDESEVDVTARLLELIRKIQLAEIESGSSDYIIFKDEKRREEIVEIGRKVCEFLKENDIRSIVFVDRSARPGYIAVTENWKKMYPSEPLPNIYFMNPRGFKSIDDPLVDFEALIMDMLGDEFRNNEDVPLNLRSGGEIEKDLIGTYGKLFRSDDRQVLLFDTCIHSGESVKPMIERLSKMGLDVKLGVVAQEEQEYPFEADLVVLDKTPEGACHPFDKDHLVEKVYTSVHSAPTLDREKKVLARQIRKEIRQVISEHYKYES